MTRHRSPVHGRSPVDDRLPVRPSPVHGRSPVDDRLPVRRRSRTAVAGLIAALLVAVLATGAGCGGGRRAGSGRSGGATASATASALPGAGGAGSKATPTPAAARYPVPTPGKVILGAYLDQSGLSERQSLARRRQQLGRDYRILHWFYDWTDGLPATLDPPARVIPMLSWTGATYASINSGSQDRLITQAARDIARYGRPVLLRWAWEMNGSWYAWSGSNNGNNPACFVAAWRHVHDIFMANGATNVGWVWGPNWYSKPEAAWNALSAYYPGDGYVDWIAISGYSDGAQTPENLFGAFYREFAGRKPLMIAETSAVDRGGRVKADWIDLLHTWIAAHPQIAALVWWDTDTTPGTSENFSIDSDKAGLEAFRQLATDPYFGG
jgi:hypothetical protein